MGRLAACALYVLDGIHFCTRLKITPTGLAATMPCGAASMSARASVNPIGIMEGTSAVTTSHICMSWITCMATGRDTDFTMVILDRFASCNLFVTMVLIRSTRSANPFHSTVGVCARLSDVLYDDSKYLKQ